MAVSGVKARLMMFEAAESSPGGGTDHKDNSTKPGKAVPPVLQKFRQNQLSLDGGSSGKTADPPSVSNKPDTARKWSKGALNTGVNGTDATNGDSGSTGATSSSDTTGGGKGGRGRVNIANTFLTGAAPPPLKPVIPVKKPSLASSNPDTTAKPSSSTESDTGRPKVALKPPLFKQSATTSASGPPKPPPKSPIATPVSPGEAHSNGNDKPGRAAFKPPTVVTSNGGSMFSGPVKLPSLGDKPAAQKTNSSASTVSSSSSSGSSSAKMPTSPPSSVRNDDTNGPIDFRSQLRKTSGAGVNTLVSKCSVESTSSADSTKDNSSAKSNEDNAKRRSSSGIPPSADTVVERPSDLKRFKKVDLNSLHPTSQPAPQKPALPGDGVDLSLICQQHTRMVQGLACDEEDDEEIYTDGSSDPVDTQTRPQKPQQSRDSQRVSMIPEMSPEEEGFDEIYDDGQTPILEDDLLYVDAASDHKPAEDEETEDVYVDEAVIMEESEEQKKKRMKEEAEAKKKEEKRQKEEEKKRKQEEKEEKRRQKTYNLTGSEVSLGQGEIKENAKGTRGRNMMAVKKGQKVTIIRLDGNPTNMWLVKTDTDMGYVESSNIEIDPNIIREAMVSGRKESVVSDTPGEEDDDQPLYEDVPTESPRSEGGIHAEDEIEEEIYEPVQ